MRHRYILLCGLIRLFKSVRCFYLFKQIKTVDIKTIRLVGNLIWSYYMPLVGLGTRKIKFPPLINMNYMYTDPFKQWVHHFTIN